MTPPGSPKEEVAELGIYQLCVIYCLYKVHKAMGDEGFTAGTDSLCG